MRISARPSRTSSTAFAAAAWLCGASMISSLPRSIPADFAVFAMLAAGPTSSGMINPRLYASTAPASAVASHGCATAVGTGSNPLHRSRRSSYFPVPVGCGTSRPPRPPSTLRKLSRVAHVGGAEQVVQLFLRQPALLQHQVVHAASRGQRFLRDGSGLLVADHGVQRGHD